MDDQQYLEDFQMGIRRGFLPVFTIMGSICCIGVIGNVFSIMFYGFVTAKKTVTMKLLTALAIFDLAVCILMIPVMIELGINVIYTYTIMCKTIHFLVHWIGNSSVLTLTCIAIERYRKICHPFKKQMSSKQVKYAIPSFILTALAMSVRDIIDHDIVEKPINLGAGENISVIYGHFCTVSEDPKLKLGMNVVLTLEAVMVIAIVSTFVVTYGNILLTIRKAGKNTTLGRSKEMSTDMTNKDKKRATDVNGMVENVSTNEPSLKLKDNDKTDNKETDEEMINVCIVSDPIIDTKMVKKVNETTKCTSCIKQQDTTEIKNEEMKNVTTIRKDNECAKLKKAERNVTLSMVTDSLVFCLCLIPYFIVRLGVRSYTEVALLELGTGIQLALRVSFINNSFNPVIYCILNPEFRNFMVRVITARKLGNSG